MLVHCRAGISRAPALAIVGAAAAGMPAPRILERLSSLAAMIRPNRLVLVLALGGAQLGMGAALLRQAMAAFSAGYACPPCAPLSSLVCLLPDETEAAARAPTQ